MKKLILILTLLTALFLAGCTGPSYEGDQCYDNSVCSVKEQYIGGCADCVPDLEVQQDNFYVNLNNDTLEANVCVKNLHGEYEGDVATSWCVSDNDHGDCNWEEETAYFKSQEVQGNLNIDVGPGKLNAWSNLQIGDQEEWACFDHKFNVAPSSDYYVYFDINNDQKVEEQNYDNNQAFKHIEGNLDLSEYLIGHDIGNFNFNDWYMNNDHVDFNGNEYKFNTYYANYENDNSGDESKVLVAAEFTQGNAEDAFSDLLTMIEEDSNGNYSMTTIGDGNVYLFPSENEILWLSEDKFVMIKYPGSPTTDVSIAYMDKHPSILVSVVPAPVEDDSLVLDMPFNKDNPLHDFSSYGNDGTLEGATLVTNNCLSGACYYFDGENDYIELPKSPSLNFDSGITLSAWVKMDILSANMSANWPTVIGKQNTMAMFVLGLDNSLFTSITDSDEIRRKTRSKDLIPLNTWTYIATTYNGSTQLTYINGNLQNNRTFWNGNIKEEPDLPFQIGGFSNQTYFNGYIDSVKVYDRGLSEDEINDIYMSGIN